MEHNRTIKHGSPNAGMVAIIFAVLFITGLSFVTSGPAGSHHFPGPWESTATLVSYFQNYPHDVLMCAFFQFGSAIPLGIFTATIVSRLKFLGSGAAGSLIALLGGFITVINVMLSSTLIWVMAYPGVAQDAVIVRALYYVGFGIGGVGYSVPLGILIAGISVTAGFMKILPKWLVALGIFLALVGELSWLSMVLPKFVYLIPLTRFPGFIWLIIIGFMLPKYRTVKNTES